MRKTLIVALARKLLIALWRLARDGDRVRSTGPTRRVEVAGL
jgi:hypothetical protein